MMDEAVLLALIASGILIVLTLIGITMTMAFALFNGGFRGTPVKTTKLDAVDEPDEAEFDGIMARWTGESAGD